jgi:hypothetical protein
MAFSRIAESGESTPAWPLCCIIGPSDCWSVVAGVAGRDATKAPVDSDAVTVETICWLWG